MNNISFFRYFLNFLLTKKSCCKFVCPKLLDLKFPRAIASSKLCKWSLIFGLIWLKTHYCQLFKQVILKFRLLSTLMQAQRRLYNSLLKIATATDEGHSGRAEDKRWRATTTHNQPKLNPGNRKSGSCNTRWALSWDPWFLAKHWSIFLAPTGAFAASYHAALLIQQQQLCEIFTQPTPQYSLDITITW